MRGIKKLLQIIIKGGGKARYYPIILTFDIYQEEKQYVFHCPELDIASCGDNVEEAFENLKEAVELYLQTLKETGQIKRVFAERGIQIKASLEIEAGKFQAFVKNSLMAGFVLRLFLWESEKSPGALSIAF